MAETPSKGIVFLVGAGPGDPGLITVRGLECVRRAEVLVYDYLANPRLVDEAPAACKRIYVGKMASRHTLSQEEINQVLVEECKTGARVVRLKGGDPFVFGRGGEEALALIEAGCAFEVVPGITAAIAVPAYAGIPVTHRGVSATLALVTGHEDPTKDESDIDFPKIATGIGTLVFYMGTRNLPLIASRLMEHGRSPATPVALIRWGTYSRQETLVGTLANIAEKAREFKPPALIVVGEVVALRGQMNWFEKRPLFGKRIIVTRSRAQAGELSRQLEELGADVVECPVIRIAPPDDPGPLANAAAKAGQYDWIIFTSINGVEAFFGALAAAGVDARALRDAKVCAIGPSTVAEIEKHGIAPDLVPPRYVAESVAEALAAQGDLRARRVLMPRADIARSFLPDALEKLGASVDDVVAYQTVLEKPANIEEIRADLAEGSIDVVTFTSSSTVRNFASLVGETFFCEVAPKLLLVSIGPETTKSIANFTPAPVIEAEEFTIDGVVNRLVRQFAE